MKTRYIFYALRPKQWIKNLFIFLPLIFGKKLFIFSESMSTLWAFIIFSMASSAGYIINDIIDFKHDRFHPIKKLRPIASEKVTMRQAKLAAGILGVVSLILSFLLKPQFGFMVTAYIALNFIYSRVLKNLVIIDVFCIGLFFLLRIAAGSIVAGVEPSHWIVFMTALIALFLGFNKRRQELKILGKRTIRHREVLAEYDLYFIDQMISVITSSIAVFYVLYTVDTRTIKEFGTNHLTYSILFVYYGIFRYLYMIHKVGKDGDPTRILLSDKKMQINIALWIIICILVIYFRI